MTDHDTTPIYPQGSDPVYRPAGQGYSRSAGSEPGQGGGRYPQQQGGYQRTRFEETTYQPASGNQPNSSEPVPPEKPKLNPGRLWAGGVMTAVVVALMMIAGVAIARGIFGITIPVPSASGTLSGFAYVALGVLGALVATALVHLLIMVAPRPLLFFSWIVFLVTVIAVLAPFQNSVFGSFSHIAMLNSKISMAVINLCVGVAIGTLIAGVARSSILIRRRVTGTTTQSWTS